MRKGGHDRDAGGRPARRPWPTAEEEAQRAERPREREQEVDDKANDDRRKAKQRIGQHDGALPTREPSDSHREAGRRAEQEGETVAVRLTRSERPMMPISLGSNRRISCAARTKAWPRSSTPAPSRLVRRR